MFVAALHALIGYAAFSGFRHKVVRRPDIPVAVFDVQEPAPAPEPLPVERRKPDTPAAPSPAAPAADPTPVLAPPPAIERPSPLVATSQPLPPLDGTEPNAGAAANEGSGDGTGTGAGGDGVGTGGEGSGLARRAERISGALLDSDYPRAALRMGIGGEVKVRFTIAEDGRAIRCMILETSGFALLDQTTCRLIERRFRYRPALDASGRPVSQDEIRPYRWGLSEPRP